MDLIFATNNDHKLQEIRNKLEGKFSVYGLSEVDIIEEIPETHETIEENAVEKAEYIYKLYNYNCFADDTGLEINALDRRPGVFSARYAGPQCSFEDNMNKVLKEMSGISDRTSCFRTVIALLIDNKTMLFEGKVDGLITTHPRGEKGFGYDPIFQPAGYDMTFAEMELDEKNKMSHRGIAVQKLATYLKTLK